MRSPIAFILTLVLAFNAWATNFYITDKNNAVKAVISLTDPALKITIGDPDGATITSGVAPLTNSGTIVTSAPQPTFALTDLVDVATTYSTTGGLDVGTILKILPGVSDLLSRQDPAVATALLTKAFDLFNKKKAAPAAPTPTAPTVDTVIPDAPQDAIDIDKLDFGANPEGTAKYSKQVGGIDVIKNARVIIQSVKKDATGEFFWDDKDKFSGCCYYIYIFDKNGRGIGCHPASHGANTDLRDVASNAAFALVYLLKRENGGSGDMVGRSFVVRL